jgi:hypothetical protein
MGLGAGGSERHGLWEIWGNSERLKEVVTEQHLRANRVPRIYSKCLPFAGRFQSFWFQSLTERCAAE